MEMDAAAAAGEPVAGTDDRYKWLALSKHVDRHPHRHDDSSIIMIALPDIFDGIHPAARCSRRTRSTCCGC
jgi:hypothetical protein